MPLTTIALAGRHSPQGIAPDIADALVTIANWLTQANFHVRFDQATRQHLQELIKPLQWPSIDLAVPRPAIDCVIVVGGDGTMLGVARLLADSGIPLIGINSGRVGFITDIPLANWQQLLPPILAGEYTQEQRSLLAGEIWRDETKIYENRALNDIVLLRGAGSGLVTLSVAVDNYFMLETRGDGLIFATPTGSTAYSLSLGGPILHPQLPGIVMTAVAPHALSNRPLVVSEMAQIVVAIQSTSPISVSFDMQIFSELQLADEVRIQQASAKNIFWHPKNWNYYDNLRHKLHWHQLPRTTE